MIVCLLGLLGLFLPDPDPLLSEARALARARDADLRIDCPTRTFVWDGLKVGALRFVLIKDGSEQAAWLVRRAGEDDVGCSTLYPADPDVPAMVARDREFMELWEAAPR